ncbi:transposase [Streptomyces sp. NPDC096013]|uniref:transposase n=1 Tax=Streptomyces sp. NPDC096013 TaxID=3366069 RepID=UPI003813B1A2
MSGHTYLQARYAERHGRPCPDRARCTSLATGSRSVAVLPRALHEIQVRNRLDQLTEQRQRRYAIRAGIEAALWRNVRAHGLRRARYRGLARTHVHHVLTATACNLSRLAGWHDTTPSTRRTYRFQTLRTAAGFTII